ncbi:MAG: hypothetical protein WCI67_15310 [Chloroflexales bacterium]
MLLDHPPTGTAPRAVIEPRRPQANLTDTPARDRYNRQIDYLRVSLTDRCNMRCVYCMPSTGLSFLPRPELLSNEELLVVLHTTAAAGFRTCNLQPHLPDAHPADP